jgi:hypothetical protein
MGGLRTKKLKKSKKKIRERHKKQKEHIKNRKITIMETIKIGKYNSHFYTEY